MGLDFTHSLVDAGRRHESHGSETKDLSLLTTRASYTLCGAQCKVHAKCSSRAGLSCGVSPVVLSPWAPCVIEGWKPAAWFLAGNLGFADLIPEDRLALCDSIRDVHPHTSAEINNSSGKTIKPVFFQL